MPCYFRFFSVIFFLFFSSPFVISNFCCCFFHVLCFALAKLFDFTFFKYFFCRMVFVLCCINRNEFLGFHSFSFRLSQTVLSFSLLYLFFFLFFSFLYFFVLFLFFSFLLDLSCFSFCKIYISTNVLALLGVLNRVFYSRWCTIIKLLPSVSSNTGILVFIHLLRSPQAELCAVHGKRISSDVSGH